MGKGDYGVIPIIVATGIFNSDRKQGELRMAEIGGYIELDKYFLPMLHDGAIALNCGRNCLAYVIEAKKIKSIWLPYFLCDSVREVCGRYNISIRYYNIDFDFLPQNLCIADDEWLYVVNYYGQLENSTLEKLQNQYKRIIVDNAQAYFQQPVKGIDTLYTCRKFFGVADGAFLYTDKKLSRPIERDQSFDRMHFLLGRFERSASEFYAEYAANNDFFVDESIKYMSKLTDNLLHAIDYDFVRRRRTENYNYFFDKLCGVNELHLKKVEGAFAYPLYIKKGAALRTKLIEKKIYVPMLWPNVLTDCDEKETEFNLAQNILPLPCDQRYCEKDLQAIIQFFQNENII